MIRISLPWPSADLSPNRSSPGNWRAHARAKKSAKNAAWGFTKAVMSAMGLRHGAVTGPVAVTLTFHPLMDRGRDVDNMQARMKAGLDGIALALGIDDKHFRPVSVIGEKRKPACVDVVITPIEGSS